MTYAEKLIEFIKRSPCAYHAVQTVREELISHGFTELYEGDSWTLADGGKYFVCRNGTSVIAFVYSDSAWGFNIVASHSDTPAFRVKPVEQSAGPYCKLWVEKYGGPILNSWFDRPLSVAGRIVVRTPEGVECRLVNIDRDLVCIPSLAIHMNRSVNEGVKINPAKEMLPLYSLGGGKSDLLKDIADTAEVDWQSIIGHDLFLYNRENGRVFGKEGELLLCPRLDDLGCAFTSLSAFLSVDGASGSMPVLAVFDNEEVGSDTKQGAASTFLYDTLKRAVADEQRYLRMVDSGMMVSADNAHARHPNYSEMSDVENAPILGGGIVVKYNANQKYATDGLSAAVFGEICNRAGVPVQNYCNRADLPGGSTLGSISNTRVSVSTVDIGIAQLAMHSSNETAGVRDIEYMVKALAQFYKTAIRREGERVIF